MKVYKRNTIQQGVAHSRLQASTHKTLQISNGFTSMHTQVHSAHKVSLYQAGNALCNFLKPNYTTFCTSEVAIIKLNGLYHFYDFVPCTYQFSFSTNLISSLYRQHLYCPLTIHCLRDHQPLCDPCSCIMDLGVLVWGFGGCFVVGCDLVFSTSKTQLFMVL